MRKLHIIEHSFDLGETVSSRLNLHERVAGQGKPHGPYFMADDEAPLPLIRRFVDERPTYGCRGLPGEPLRLIIDSADLGFLSPAEAFIHQLRCCT